MNRNVSSSLSNGIGNRLALAFVQGNVPAQAWVTLIVGLAATIGVLVTWRQKNKSSEWWRRTAWAFEPSLSDNNVEAEVGWKVLRTLVESKLTTKSDSDVVQVIAEHMTLDEHDE